MTIRIGSLNEWRQTPTLGACSTEHGSEQGQFTAIRCHPNSTKGKIVSVHAKKVCGVGAEIWGHSFLISGLDEDESLSSRPSHFTSEERATGLS